jgi:hypothetical protein
MTLPDAWINQPRKNDAPQLSRNNNFMKAIEYVLPDGSSNKQAILKEWHPVARNDWWWWNNDDECNEHNENESVIPENFENNGNDAGLKHTHTCKAPQYKPFMHTQYRTIDTINSISISYLSPPMYTCFCSLLCITSTVVLTAATSGICVLYPLSFRG